MTVPGPQGVGGSAQRAPTPTAPGPTHPGGRRGQVGWARGRPPSGCRGTTSHPHPRGVPRLQPPRGSGPPSFRPATTRGSPAAGDPAQGRGLGSAAELFSQAAAVRRWGRGPRPAHRPSKPGKHRAAGDPAPGTMGRGGRRRGRGPADFLRVFPPLALSKRGSGTVRSGPRALAAPCCNAPTHMPDLRCPNKPRTSLSPASGTWVASGASRGLRCPSGTCQTPVWPATALQTWRGLPGPGCFPGWGPARRTGGNRHKVGKASLERRPPRPVQVQVSPSAGAGRDCTGPTPHKAV